jgi:hypothetical protein
MILPMMILSCHDSVGFLRWHKKSCSKYTILGYSTAKVQRRKDLREAFGARPACWRCRKLWGGAKAGASSAHSKRFAQFGCGTAALG